MIDSFKGDYFFLSNFYPRPFLWRGVEFPTAEHAFQWAKVDEVSAVAADDRAKVLGALTPQLAKKFGRRVRMRPDWDEVKLDIILDMLYAKFADPIMRASLLSTGDEELIEGNWWGDTYWGVCKGEGHNHLGKLLMEVREVLR